MVKCRKMNEKEEMFIKDDGEFSTKGEHIMGKKVLIATLFKSDPVMLATTKLSPDRLILLVGKEPHKDTEKSLDIIKSALGNVIDIKIKRVDILDVVQVAESVVDIIEMQPSEDKVYVNITAGRKTLALGALYGAYARSSRVRRIAYNPEEDKSSVIYLPKMNFRLNQSQHKILDMVAETSYATTKQLAEAIDLSPAMLYRTLDELKEMGFVTVEDSLQLTDAGKIARL